MKQLEFDFYPITHTDALRTHIINERLLESEKSPIVEETEYYRTTKLGDWILDTFPYGWRIYHTVGQFRNWTITKYQQLRYGVADSECWSLDYTFTRYMLPRLKHFRNMKRYSYPSDVTPEEWERILDEIIWAFDYMANEEKYIIMPHFDSDIEKVFDMNRPKTLEREIEWRNYFDKMKSLQHRKVESLKLFAKYYEALWD
jgi:hypothetical protein